MATSRKAAGDSRELGNWLEEGDTGLQSLPLMHG